jgi:dTDP-4-dehydrorhamnose 3,5-epimerase
MQATALEIAGLFVFEPRVFADERGAFFESFNATRFREATGLDLDFVQDNHSISRQGVVRGLHYQLAPHAQGKLVRVVTGRVWDVAVDIRPDSPSFGKWAGVELSAQNRKQFWIPAGFAHGFVALEDDTQFLYKTTALWHGASERAIRWNDPALAIDWPVPGEAIVSGKDAVAPLFADAELPKPEDHR